MVFWSILCHIFASGINKFVNRSSSCLFIYSILKNLPSFQPFLEIGSLPTCLYSLDFLLYMTKTYTSNVIFTFNIVFSLDNYFLYAFFLKFKFSIIFELLILENNDYCLEILIIWEGIVEPRFWRWSFS